MSESNKNINNAPVEREIEELRKRAENGDADAQYELGDKYFRGKGVGQSDADTFHWWCEAAINGHKRAQGIINDWILGKFNVPGPEDIERWKKAAKQGNVYTQALLGHCYLNGLGVDQSDAEAFHWYCEAAKNGDSDAQYVLGDCYSKGLGVDHSDADAFHWYNEAAMNGHGRAQDVMHNWINDEHYVPGPEDIERWKKAAEQGNTFTQALLGDCYSKGLGVDQSDTDAFHWYSEAAKNGNRDALCRIGDCYRKGLGVDQSDAGAFHWYNEAAEKGQKDAQIKLDRMLFRDGYVPEIKAEDITRWKKHLNAHAAYWLGYCYEKGILVDQKGTMAEKFWGYAALHGHKGAHFAAGYVCQFASYPECAHCSKNGSPSCRFYYEDL